MSLLHPNLEAFLAVVKRSTVHGAALDIGLTQTGVTQRIRSLERQLGTTLFTRSRKGMRLTTEGEAFYRYCQGVRDLEGEFLAYLHGQSDEQTVRMHVTGPSSVMRSRVIPGAVKVLDHHDNLTFTFNLDDDRSGLEYLKSGRSQMAVLHRHEVVKELDSKLLKPLRYILVTCKAWETRSLREIIQSERIVDFNPSDDATFQYLKKHRLYDLAKKERHLANNTDALAMLVTEGCGYSVLSEDFASRLIERGEIVNKLPGKYHIIEFALAWYPRHEMPDYFRSIIKTIW